MADVDIKESVNQIQRENAARRIIVGFNVRNRDIQSTVNDLQNRVNSELKLPAGYSITYGGNFENLQEAKARLGIAVPVSVIAHFTDVVFCFPLGKVWPDYFTAIPLSAVGGVFALWLRGMDFSISAGIGFIALFGVAVLNGIVLIAEFNRQKTQKEDLRDVVLTGGKTDCVLY